MTPFNNELQVGQPAMIINVEFEKNRHSIGTTIIVDALHSIEESKEIMKDSSGFAYARFSRDSQPRFIRQNYLMPLPPLGDVYEDEMTDVLENLKVNS